MKSRFSALIAIVLLVAFSLPVVKNISSLQAASVCNASQFVADITIPAGTHITNDASRVETWLIQNAGICAWTTGTILLMVTPTSTPTDFAAQNRTASEATATHPFPRGVYA